MNWKFWKKAPAEASGAGQAVKLEKPKDLPERVGRKMVVEMKLEPDAVWALRYVSRPVLDRKKTSEFRIFDPAKTNMAGVVVKNWNSLDDQPTLVMYSGIYDRVNDRVDFQQI